MRSRGLLILFVIFAPITVPAYLLALAGSNLLGAAFYVVIEAALVPLLGRPVALSRVQMALLAVPVVLAAIPVTAALLLIWLVRHLGIALAWIGHWQTAARTKPWAFAAGTCWVLVALWITTTCLNAAIGLSWIGMPVQGRDEFIDHWTRLRELGQMPLQMQQRRTALLADLETRQAEIHPEHERLRRALAEDDTLFCWLPEGVARRLAGLPWFFVPSEVSEDGSDHSVMLMGPLLFAWMLLFRWPGTWAVLRIPSLRTAGYLARMSLAAGAIFWLVTWTPHTAYLHFFFGEEGPNRLFRLASPAAWVGFDPFGWVRAEWYVFNAGLWLILVAAALFVWWLAWRVSPLLGWPRYYIAFFAARLLQRKRIAFFSVGAVSLCVAMMIIVISVMGGFADHIRDRAQGLLGHLVMEGGAQGFPYYDEFIRRIGELRETATGEPLVVQATPLIRTYGLLRFPEAKTTHPVQILGIRLDEFVRVNEFGRDLFYQKRFGGTHLRPQKQPFYGYDDALVPMLPGDMEEHWRTYLAGLPEPERVAEEKRYRREPRTPHPGPGVFALNTEGDMRPVFRGQDYPGMIIGRDILFRRLPSGEYRRSPRFPRGEHCLLTLLPLTRTGDVSPEPPPKPSFRYVDDSRTGIFETDSKSVYVDFDVLQRLLSMEAQPRTEGGGMASPLCSQIQIRLHGLVGSQRDRLLACKRELLEVWEELRQELHPDPTEFSLMQNVDIQTWEEMQRSYISAIEKEKFLVLIMFGVISVVAVFLILCIFYMIVQEKTRDIGIIKSVGGSGEGVTAVFLAYGGAIGLVGSVLGSLLGITFVEHINEVQDFLARLNPAWRVWSPEQYSFDRIPDVWKWSEVIGIGILAMIASVVGAAFPAFRAGRTWPVETLRYE